MALVDEWTTAYRLSYSNSSDTGYKEYTENGNYVKVSFSTYSYYFIHINYVIIWNFTPSSVEY